jgi:DNA repair photolyase
MRRTITGRHSFTGRGALSNPPGRFESKKVEEVDDGWYVEESPDSIPTTLEPDKARSIISTNDSPDVPFEQSINPYRGCSHACVYCVWGETEVLLANGRTLPIARLPIGAEIYGTRRVGAYRRYEKTKVLARWGSIKPAFKITTEDGTTLVASGDHRFLTERGWKYVTDTASPPQRAHLTTNNRLLGTGAFAKPVRTNDDYRRGYLCGMIRGDAWLGKSEYHRKDGKTTECHQFRLALCDTEALVRARDYLLDFEVTTSGYLFQAASGARRAMYAIRASGTARVGLIRDLVAWPNELTKEWAGGFLAGIFDAEGSFSQTVWRIKNTDPVIIGWSCRCLGMFGFRFVVEHLSFESRKSVDVVRLVGGLREHLRFFHTFCPAITRKLDLSGQAVKGDTPLRVMSVEPLGTMRLYDITTGTGDFIANGIISHNCYARPSHAYLGLSPGLDFETRLFYKADAGKVLEAELARPDYVCKAITLGANTDPYQPDERRMKVTRSILEVLARTHHPVTILTKGALVLRDLDLLKDMAARNLASVGLSITTLDNELKRTMEPRTASPAARLRALKELSAAGVPAGVLVAPVIPALTDHEMEGILEAASAAGAQWAGYVLLRLPYEIKDLFKEWLAEHYPDRAAHVMSLIRAMRDGRENDPNFGSRMRGTGPYAQLLRNRFRLACQRLNLNATRRDPLDTTLFRPPVPAGGQMRLGL